MGSIGSGNKLNPGSGRPLVLMALRVPLEPKEVRSGSAVVHNAQLKELRGQGFDPVMVFATNYRSGVASYPTVPMVFMPDAAARTRLPPDPTLIPYADFNFPVVDGLPNPLSAAYYSRLTDAQLGRSYSLWQWGLQWAILQYGIPDMVWHSHAEEHNGLLAGVLPAVFTAHVNRDSQAAVEHRLDSLREFGLGRMRTGFAISPTIASQLSRDSGGFMTPERVVLAPNGVNVLIFNPQVDGSRESLLSDYRDRLAGLRADDIWLVTAGRASHEKGVDAIIEALAELRRSHPDGHKIHLVVIGSMGDEQLFKHDPYSNKHVDPYTYRGLAEKFGVADAVHFMGRMEQKQMARFYKAVLTDGSVVLASRQEACPLVKPEVMAVGVPPIVTQIDGFEGIVANYPGNPSDIVRFAAPENPYGLSVLAAARSRLLREETALARATRLLLNDVIEVEGRDQFMLPEGVRGLDSEPSIYLRRVLWETAQSQAAHSLAVAIQHDLQEPTDQRIERGTQAAQFSNSHWSIGGSVRGLVPTLQAVMAEGPAADFTLDAAASTELHPLREERLADIAEDTIVHSAYLALRNAAEQSAVAIGQAWRAFNVAVAVFMGTRSNFRHPFDPDAYGLKEPHTVLREVARAAGAPDPEMRQVMRVVLETPVEHLVGVGRAHQDLPGASPKGSQYFALLAQHAASGSKAHYQELLRVLSANLGCSASDIMDTFAAPEAQPERALRIRAVLPEHVVMDVTTLMRQIAERHLEVNDGHDRRPEDHHPSAR